MLAYALITSLGFAVLYMQTVLAHGFPQPTAIVIGLIAYVVFLLSFRLPEKFFNYTHQDVAPHVQTQVLSRAALASLLIVVMNAFVWFALDANSVALLEEMYMYSLVAVLLFHGFVGAIASHVVYLQQTKQYNSNQLVAVLVLVTLILIVLILYFVALDWAIARDAAVHVRDLLLITLVLLGFGRAIYLMAHN